MIRTTSLMTRQLVTVPHTATVMDAASLMRERRIGSVFVERHGDIVGIVTEADIVPARWLSGICPDSWPWQRS